MNVINVYVWKMKKNVQIMVHVIVINVIAMKDGADQNVNVLNPMKIVLIIILQKKFVPVMGNVFAVNASIYLNEINKQI